MVGGVNKACASLLVVPGSPALVRELAPRDEPSQRLLQTVREISSNLPNTMEIVCSHERKWATAQPGSFGPWGAPDVCVGDGHVLGELIARYCLPNVTVKASRDSLSPLNPSALTVVVIDGPAGLTARAPLSLLPSAHRVHEQLQLLLAGKEHQQIDEGQMLEAGVIEPQLWRELQTLRPESATLLDTDDSLGVGRYVAYWEVEQ